MDIFKYKGATVHVPTNWEDVTLAMYEDNYKRDANTLREKIAIIASMCGLTAEELGDWEVDAVNEVLSRVSFIFEPLDIEPSAVIEVNGIKYTAPCEDSLTLAQWVDADEAHKEDRDTLSTVLAIVCNPIGESYNPANTDERKELFRTASVAQVQPVISFFLLRRQLFEDKIATSSNLTALHNQLAQNITRSRKSGAGLKLSTIYRIAIYYALTWWYNYQSKRQSRKYASKTKKHAQKKRKGN